MALYDGVNGVARKVTKFYDGVSGVARKVTKAYSGVNGVARKYYSGVEMVTIRINCADSSSAPDPRAIDESLGVFEVNGELHYAYYESPMELSVPKGAEIKIYQCYAASQYDSDHSALIEEFCLIELRKGGSTVDYWTGEYDSATLIADTDMEIVFTFDVYYGFDASDWFVAGVTYVAI